MTKAISDGKIKACNVVEEGGVAASVFKACMGNKLGATWNEVSADTFAPKFGDFVILADDVSDWKAFEIEKVAELNGT